ncbi:DNA protecting protein DprA, putative [Synechococcus sp. PCC 7335]|uniref:DNA-processing protein DprA n=1 Tax=Synechococcus sp. (strain ATCC 29403 / PCC 7335) TaxID=91464 RepID=UPI00017EC406|nr:DNA-processing protein DprA [Synechococcus sp. PCC 7335]EDX85193.1 DNA protecting protein DprA, putative [Synechococcus sp. PCC 7335]
MASERAYWLAWSQVKHVGPVTIKRLWEHFGTLELAWQATASELLKVDGIGLLSAERIVSVRSKLNPEQLLVEHEKKNKAFWTPVDADYPALLFAINDPPPVLYYRGSLRLSDLNRLTVGIVGTRRPSTYGKRWTQRLSQRLSQQGAVIISGLAAGIDTEAHTGCLYQQGLTVAVVGTGVDIVYPARNQSLYQQVVENGLVVSEYPDGTGPDRTHFPQRNRIIAGLSRAILVTEAPARSGALITARLANDYGREVYALPSALGNEQGEGCLRLIAEGAQIILGEQVLMDTLEKLPAVDSSAVPNRTVSSQSDLLKKTTSEKVSSKRDIDTKAVGNLETSEALEINSTDLKKAISELTPVLANVLEAVAIEPTIVDYIVQQTQMETGIVLSALFQLELSGMVIQLPGMQYQRA